MENANISYLDTYAAPLWPGWRLFWTWLIAALCILDVVLLFWLINPMARPDTQARLTSRALSSPTEQSIAYEKPSPLGSAAFHKSKRAQRAASKY